MLCEDIRIGLHKQPECFATWSLFLVKRVLVEETLLVGARVFLLNVPVKCDDEQAHRDRGRRGAILLGQSM